MRKNKIKQQRQIKSFLCNEFGKEVGECYFQKQSGMLKDMIVDIKGKTENQRNTLCHTILPRVALYKVLSDECPSEETTRRMKKYMLDFVAVKKHAATAKMELFPGFYFFYSRIFLKIMRTTDLQISTQKIGKDFYDITITKCIWHTACIENGCEELCALFCDVDDVTYGGLKKIGFSRTQTLGYNGNCCDFHFYKK